MTMKLFVQKTALLIMLAALLSGAASCSKKSPTGKPSDVDYYTCTMHPSVRTQDPKGKCPICSMDLVPVMKQSGGETLAQVSSPSEQQSKDAEAKPSPSRQGERKIKYYKSTMMPGETNAKPAKDSMGMDMVPVYERSEEHTSELQSQSN